MTNHSRTGVADHMRIALGEPGELGRIDAGVHTGQHGEAARRRNLQICFVAKVPGIGGIGRQHLIEDSTHVRSSAIFHQRVE